jgi:hypothetical protein
LGIASCLTLVMTTCKFHSASKHRIQLLCWEKSLCAVGGRNAVVALSNVGQTKYCDMFWYKVNSVTAIHSQCHFTNIFNTFVVVFRWLNRSGYYTIGRN